MEEQTPFLSESGLYLFTAGAVESRLAIAVVGVEKLVVVLRVWG